MDIHILLTDYQLKFMYGERAFQDPILLSREVLKKAYHDGLYFIGREKVIDKICENKKFSTRSLFFFAGIPSIEEISLVNVVSPVLYAVKIELSYEVLAMFSYGSFGGETVLKRENISLQEYSIKKVCLHLKMVDKKPVYVEEERIERASFCPEEKEELKDYFLHSIKEYKFIVEKNLDALRKKLENFLNSSQGLGFIDDPDNLQRVKESYEDLVVVMK